MAEDIKCTNLYKFAHRIYHDLEKLGYSTEDQLQLSDVTKFDQLHYFGVDAVKCAVPSLQITQRSRVLEIGSGVGGPSRVLADFVGCHVDALELQEDHHLIAVDLTTRCGLDGKVNHINADILSYDTAERYDAIVSWLVFLHIHNKTSLFEKCHALLQNGSKIFIEDFFQFRDFTKVEKVRLKKEVFALNLSTEEEYINGLEKAGFNDIQFVDKTSSFVKFANDRVNDYRSKSAHHIQIQGDEVYNQQLQFQQTIADLFNGGHLGGCRIVATK